MKRLLTVAIFFVCMAEGETIVAQPSDESSVAIVVEILRKAILDGDKSVLEKITAEKLTYGHSNGQIEDRAEFIAALAAGKADFTRIDISDQKILITGNTAVVRHVLKGDVVLSGNPVQLNLAVLLVWQKQGNEWKLLARQAIKI